MSERGNKLNKLIDRYIGIPLTVPALLFRKLEKRRTNSYSKISILCMGAIGDVLLLSGLINALRSKVPNATIDLYTTKANAQAALLVSGVDNIHSFSLSQIKEMVQCMRSKKYDVLLDSTQWARVGAIISAFSKALVTVGFATAGQYRSLAYDRSVKHRNDQHEWQNFMALGQALLPDLDGRPYINAPTTDIDLPKQPYIVCHMWAAGSHSESRRWGDDKWVELIGKLQGYTVVLSGSGADREPTADFMAKYNLDCVNLAGATSLAQMATLLSHASALVSVNTGTMHMGALLNIPTVGIHGPTNPLRWGPVGDKTMAVSPEGAVMTLNLGFEEVHDSTFSRNVNVEAVLSALSELGVQITA
ncbi:MAG: glycosyltransferase family 9 protein [Deferribacteraceae bacterium]|jgi:ADP-heptose:LPS heptosyltransferase|nr:glycosyltransferase family 9 protein [Deferribacteraceae bacterium]